jgi:hypothetical protein
MSRAAGALSWMLRTQVRWRRGAAERPCNPSLACSSWTDESRKGGLDRRARISI